MHYNKANKQTNEQKNLIKINERTKEQTVERTMETWRHSDRAILCAETMCEKHRYGRDCNQ